MPRPSNDITHLLSAKALAEALDKPESWVYRHWRKYKCLRETVSRFGAGRGGGLRWPNTVVGRVWAEQRRMSAAKAKREAVSS